MTLVPQNRSQLFFDQFEFSGRLFLKGVSCTRAKTVQEVKQHCDWANHTRRLPLQRRLDDQDIENLLDFHQQLRALNTSGKSVFYQNHFYLYTNDLSELQRLNDLPYVSGVHAQQACLTLPRDSISLTRPRNKYRAYFRNRRIVPEQFAVLQHFLLQRTDLFRCSPSLNKVLRASPYRYCFGNWFVDFDHAHDYLLLNMVSPGYVRPPLNIVAK